MTRLTGNVVHDLKGLSANDDVWYNAGDNQYFLAGGSRVTLPGGAPPILGVVDPNGSEDEARGVAFCRAQSSLRPDLSPAKGSATLCGKARPSSQRKAKAQRKVCQYSCGRGSRPPGGGH